MLLYPRQYVRFLDGRMGNMAIVAFLPGHLAAQMPTLSTDVRIGREYAQKLWAKHGLGHGSFRLFQPAIDHGWCAKSRDNGLDFIYIDSSRAYIDARGEPVRFILGLKSARGGQETWVTTLHPSTEQQVRRRLRRATDSGRLIRAHSWA
jgi:hypothetical protein